MTQSLGARGYVRPLAGLGMVMAIVLIILVVMGLFRGRFTDTVPVTVISERAGLVMNDNAKVQMRGVLVGKVHSIEQRSDGKAVLRLAMDPSQLHLIPENVGVDIASTTAFGAKFVQLIPPPDPSPNKIRAGQVLQGQHVTVEINTVFQQLVNVLDKIDSAKLNETLGAIASAFNGRGEKIGKTLVDFNAFLAKIEPSLPDLAHDIEVAAPTFGAYADAAPDLVATADNATRISKSIIDEQQNLDAFLVSAIGLADVGNEVIGGNRQSLTDMLHVLVPTTDVLNRYHEGIWCSIAGAVAFAKSVPQFTSAWIAAGITLGVDRYRYPEDLPKVAAKGRPYCKELGLPVVPPESKPPIIIGDVGANPMKYGNQGILLNSDGLKQWLFGPIPGPPRNSAQIGMPG